MSADTAPRITGKPSLKQEDNGNKLIINCEIEASPKPEIKWFKENTQLVDSSRIKSKISNGKTNKSFVLELEIDNLTSDDSGMYKVNAKNRLGEVSASIALNFAGKFQYVLFTKQSIDSILIISFFLQFLKLKLHKKGKINSKITIHLLS